VIFSRSGIHHLKKFKVPRRKVKNGCRKMIHITGRVLDKQENGIWAAAKIE